MTVLLESNGVQRLFKATGGTSGMSIWIDVRKGEGIERQGPRPMELVSMGLAACLAANVMAILEKQRLTFTGIRLVVDAQRASAPPQHFEHIGMRLVVESDAIGPDRLNKVLELAAKYCSAHRTLSEGVPITVEGTAEAPTIESP